MKKNGGAVNSVESDRTRKQHDEGGKANKKGGDGIAKGKRTLKRNGNAVGKKLTVMDRTRNEALSEEYTYKVDRKKESREITESKTEMQSQKKKKRKKGKGSEKKKSRKHLEQASAKHRQK